MPAWGMKVVICCLVAQAAASVLKSQEANRAVSHKTKDRSFLMKPKNKGTPLGGAIKNPFEEKKNAKQRLKCGETEQVNAKTDKYEKCPAECAYFAQNRQDDDFCTFLCVSGDQCGKYNPMKPIPDNIKGSKTCRGPKVSFCREPELDGTDSCKVCQTGFALNPADKACYFEYWNTIIAATVIFVVIMLVVIVWFVDMCCRPSVNDESVTQAEAWRSRSKIIDRSGHHHGPHSLSTNLTHQPIGGPGLLLHFRFQLFFILWPLCIAIVWTILACFHNELFVLGTRKFGTPRHNCILVFWGYETQQSLMWTKVLFLAIVYVFSFIGFLLFSVSQHRVYQRHDAEEKTMKDFALEISGLPEISGAHMDVEEKLQKTLEKALDKELIGISIAWNFSNNQDEVYDACNKQLVWRETEYKMEKANGGRRPSAEEVDQRVAEEYYEKTLGAEQDKPKWMPEKMYQYERDLICPLDDLAKFPTTQEKREQYNQETAEMLKGFVTSSNAFVVFKTSEDKDEALHHVSEGNQLVFDATAYGFGQETITLEPITQEPANVNWHNFGDHGQWSMVMRFIKGFFKVYLPALAIWFFVFYVPYAWSLYTFNYDNGAELPGYYSFLFTIIVCGGNATMYFVCDLCCDIIGFRYKDTKQVTYMLMYLCACMFNVFLDMVVTYKVAWRVMVGLDFRTYTGTRLRDIEVFTEQFETYAMQRSLGENVYVYAWPSTFFLCFVIEPFVTIMIPYLLGKVIVRTHREVRGTCAEAYMMAFELDLGRYADILLNVFLGILIFYFPGGYIWTLFFAMAFSHSFIYCFDHWKVIQVIPFIRLVSPEVDWYAQLCMIGCCGIILSCLVFKGNCESYLGYCMQEEWLIGTCALAGLAHCIVHYILFRFLVPCLGLDIEDENEGMSYEAVAKTEARTWFSVNPVHCLRSKFMHNHEKHCRLCVWGKEHLLEVNKDIKCFFQGVEAKAESFDIRKSITGLRSQFSKDADADDEEEAPEEKKEEKEEKK